jgi:RIP metalloprotease RseP
VEFVRPKDPVELVTFSAEQTAGLISVISQGVLRVLSDPSMLADSGVSGPVGVLRTGAELAKYDVTAIVAFAATLSVNLAVVNSIPFPALDGGQLMLALIQAASRGKFSKELQDRITILAFSLLALASVYATVSDLIPTDVQTPTNTQFMQRIK